MFKKITGRSAWSILLCHLLMFIVFYPLDGNALDNEVAQEEKTPASSHMEKPKGINAVAVYYADRYHGRKTHSGARFSQNRLTAAHPTLPHGTRVKVINPANHRSVIVTITDRCRKRRFEIIDLSRAAARKLGFLHKGSAKVVLIPLTTDQQLK
jgi:rare lipoprotein A